jgi:import inner membrane translocase subunit TIM16
MAPIGPLGRILAQVVVPVIAILARALPAAYAAAVQNAKKNGAQAARDPSPFAKATMSRSEAFQIMNLAEQEAAAEAIQKVCFYMLGVTSVLWLRN